MTFVLGATSRGHLLGVHPALVRVVERAIQLTAQDFAVHEGVRSIEDQRAAVASGHSKTMAGKHLVQPDGFGWAVDLVPWVDGRAQWRWGEPGDHCGGCYEVAAAMRHAAAELHVNLRWGGVWDRALLALPMTAAGMREARSAYAVRHKGPDLLDGPHFELTAPAAVTAVKAA